MNLKLSAVAALTALALAAPAAQAKVDYEPDAKVCNQATHVSLGGNNYASDDDPTPPARYKQNLHEHRGNGKGLQNAATHSPALSFCSTDVDGGGDGDDDNEPPVDA